MAATLGLLTIQEAAEIVDNNEMEFEKYGDSL
jgi:hypothetical protein